MRTTLLLLLAASGLTGPASAAEVWKWVDSSGVTHYSDQPGPNATRIEVRSGNVAETRPTDVGMPRSASSDSSSADATRYRDFAINRPEADQSIINTGGQVNVEIRVEPGVQPQHTLSLYLDGKLVTGFPPSSLSYLLTEVPRGVHSVRAVIRDQTGTTIQETSSVTFNVRQESIANPPVGPTLRPQPPKPQPRGAANKVLTTQPSYGALNGAPPAVNPTTNLPVAPKPKPKPKKP